MDDMVRHRGEQSKVAESIPSAHHFQILLPDLFIGSSFCNFILVDSNWYEEVYDFLFRDERQDRGSPIMTQEGRT